MRNNYSSTRAEPLVKLEQPLKGGRCHFVKFRLKRRRWNTLLVWFDVLDDRALESEASRKSARRRWGAPGALPAAARAPDGSRGRAERRTY
ncbi:hypothetical protein EVAR_18966_1 [Eumeta japonica]|uniref:Uncharacterized protein n=1 Tax=Eumeta variegata TaxID=151549 RepID=A0A4C1X063_EUMVA|nr:hypothetical protein EVAR_18966_1 [Eumeta japonica]